MVLESLVASLLAKYLGTLIDGLTPENLRLAIVGGALELRNLKFKSEVSLSKERVCALCVFCSFLGVLCW